jgi:hypothetical protein
LIGFIGALEKGEYARLDRENASRFPTSRVEGGRAHGAEAGAFWCERAGRSFSRELPVADRHIGAMPPSMWSCIRGHGHSALAQPEPSFCRG